MNSAFFSNNRRRLLRSIEGEVFVFTANMKLQDIGDSAHTFNQEPNFYYLSGISEPGWIIVFDSDFSWLIAPDISQTEQLFDGQLDYVSAKNQSGVDSVISSAEGAALLDNLAIKYRTVHTAASKQSGTHTDLFMNPASGRLRKRLSKIFPKVGDCTADLRRLRAIKLPEEIALIEEASKITANAFSRAKSRIAADGYEFEIEAELIHEFRKNNARHGFDPIVASGANACTLHYTANSDALSAGELLLIDAGAKLRAYSSDVTRTFAVGNIGARRSDLHHSLRQALDQITELIQPGTEIRRYLSAADSIMKKTLIANKLISRENDDEGYRRYFPHSISHGIGLELHESLGGYKELLPGMVLTVEPGVYIPDERIGLRLENTVLVTDKGASVLTSAISTEA